MKILDEIIALTDQQIENPIEVIIDLREIALGENPSFSADYTQLLHDVSLVITAHSQQSRIKDNDIWIETLESLIELLIPRRWV